MYNILRQIIFLLTPIIFLYAKDVLNPNITCLTMETGLANNTIECIYQDRQGYMWFGTQDGLSRYDGYSFLNYKHDPNDSCTLSDNIVYHVFDDGRYLWLGTAGKLNRFDPFTSEFNALPINGVSSIVSDSNGVIWAGSLFQGLYGIDEQMRIAYHLTKDNSGIGSDNIRDLLYDENGALWVCTEGGGITKISFKNDSLKFNSFRCDANDGYSINSDSVISVCQDGDGNFWFGTRNKGLELLTKSGNFEHFRYDSENSNSLPSDEIRTVIYDTFSNSIWAGTYRDGICRLKIEENKKYAITRLSDNLSGGGIINDCTLTCLFIDRSATFWKGTYHSGVYKFTLPRVRFKIYKSQHSSIFEENGADYVWTFYEDIKGQIWAGGINGLSLLTMNKTSKGKLKGLYFNGHKNIQVRHILTDHSGTIWAATIGRGLVQLEMKKDNVAIKPVKYAYPFEGSKLLYCMVADNTNDSLLWIGSNGAGLIRYNKYTKKTVCYPVSKISTEQKQSFGWVCAIEQDTRGILWLGTWNNGLYMFNPRNRQMIHYYKQIGKNSLNNNTVLYIHSSGDSVLWLGTHGGGLNRFSLNTKTFHSYTTREGLPNNIVYGIVEDDQHDLWLSTNKGIAFFRQADGSLKSFTADDGLPCNEFNLGACFKNSKGKIFFGSTEGILSFNPVKVINPKPPQISLTAFKKYGKAIKLNKPLREINEFHLGYNDKVLSFEFVGLHYKNSLKNQYAYMLQGIDGDWIYCGSNRKASYQNLAPGTYVFKIKAANCDGVWVKKAKKIKLIIASPFWQKPWFYLVNLFLIGILFYSIHQIRLKQILNIETAKLAERERLRRKMSVDFHDELGHRVSKIALLSKILLNETAFQKQSTKQYLKQIAENADKLFAEMREFVWELDPQKDSLYDLMSQLKSFSDSLFDSTEIAFQIEGLNPVFEEMKLNMEWRQNLLRIFKEGMTNILKHATICRNVQLQIVFKEDRLLIVLSDDDVGFNINTVSSGNGLKNMQERAEKIGGMLQIVSAPGEGTKIIFNGKLS